MLETYLDEMMGRWKSVIVAGTGNEGNAAGHTAVTLQEGVQTEIQFGVAAGEAGVMLLIGFPLTRYLPGKSFFRDFVNKCK